jgi:hypothetical protein
MKRPTPEKRMAQLDIKLEALARDYVNAWIELGCETWAMQSRRDVIARTFADSVTRDIRAFAETGKYPEYAR